MEVLLHDEDGSWRHRDIATPAQEVLILSCYTRAQGARSAKRRWVHKHYALDRASTNQRHLSYEHFKTVINDSRENVDRVPGEPALAAR